MNKKPMDKVIVAVILFFIFIFVLFEIVFVLDTEVPIDVKFICSGIFLTIIIIGLVFLIKDFILRKKIQKTKIQLIEKQEEIISIDDWNYNEIKNKFPDKRGLYDKEINEALGEERVFSKEIDKYGNIVLKSTNNNIVDWFIIFIYGSSMSIVAILAYFYNKANILALLIMLLISLTLSIFSFLQINRVRKLKLKIKFFQIIKLIFMLGINISVLGAMFIVVSDYDISKINFEKIIIYIIFYVMSIGLFAFVYQLFLIIHNKFMKK